MLDIVKFWIKVFGVLTKKIDLIANKLQFKLAGLKFHNSWKIHGRINILNEGKLQIGHSFQANSSKNATADFKLRIIIRKNGKLFIGDNVGISNSTIVCQNKIEIGDFVYIGGGSKIWDTDFHSLDPVERIHNGDTEIKTAPVSIGDYAFIGGSSIILKGVSIGENAIVGAGSVVTKSIPNNEIWGGNPARYIKTLTNIN